MQRLIWMLPIALLVVLVCTQVSSAANILVIKVYSYPQSTNAINHLNSLGHTVTVGGTLANYSAFDQVWDLRFAKKLTEVDVDAMGNFLRGGGSMYMAGEGSAYDARNNSLRSFVSSVGGGTVSLIGDARGSQSITAQGQAVNSPNVFGSVSFHYARTSATAGSGFLVTEQGVGSGRGGSLVGWDLGDISGSPDARMLVGFDIEIFQNGVQWTENMATYLGDESPGSSVPEPSTFILALLATIGLSFYRRRRRRA